ncbi:MAG: AraC family ligand binding domain-containing protein [Lentisphaeria bacterium]|nr:MAG: AraC family ligand binding domain-containing protein [Lentisphaeria bacterium]
MYPRSVYLKRKFPFSIGRHCHRPGDFPPDQYHVREFYKIVYFFHGEGEYLVDGRCYPIQPGTVILAHPRFETTYRILGASLDVCNILFLPEFIRENLAKLKNRSGFFSIFNEAEPTMSGLYVFPCVKELEKLFLRMLAEYRVCEENYHVTLELLLTDLLIQLSRNAQKGMLKFKSGDIYNTLKQQIEEHCTEPFSLDETAEKFGVSKSHLCRLYRRGKRFDHHVRTEPPAAEGGTADVAGNGSRRHRSLLQMRFPRPLLLLPEFPSANGMTPLAFRKNGSD